METEHDEQFIEWDHERYSSHIERFDEQHQHLFGLLNDLYLAMEEGRSEEKVGDILRELEAYTEYHFGDEEEFMQDCGFAMDCSNCFYNHREMHDEFAQKVTELRKKHENGEYISMEVLLFARDWLDSHIAGLNQDQSYAEYYVDEVPNDYDYEPGKLKQSRATEDNPHIDGEAVPDRGMRDGASSTTSEADGSSRSTDSEDVEREPTDSVTLGTEIREGAPLDVPEAPMSVWAENVETAYADSPAVRHERDGEIVSRSYRELLADARSLAAGLLDSGVEQGDRVGIHLPAGYDWTVLDLACYVGGFVSVPISLLYQPRRAAHVVEDAGVDTLVTDGTPVPPLEDAVETVHQPETLPRIDDPSLPAIDADPDDVATIVYRIGTTEHPRGCAITHRNLRAAMAMLSGGLSLEPGDTGTCFLPLGHMYQRVALYSLLNTGGAIAYMDPDAFLDQLTAVEPDVIVGVPQVYRQLTEEIRSQTDDVSGLRQALSEGVAQSYGQARDSGGGVSTHLSLKHTVAERTVFSSLRENLGLGNVELALTGTEAIDAELVQFLRGFGVPLSEIYGATEISGLATINHAGSHPAGTVGAPFPGVEVALADDDGILVRGPNVIEGYWNDTQSWRRMLAEGWYHTGDLGAFTEEGSLRIRGPK